MEDMASAVECCWSVSLPNRSAPPQPGPQGLCGEGLRGATHPWHPARASLTGFPLCFPGLQQTPGHAHRTL
jgi:hypothetical protein